MKSCIKSHVDVVMQAIGNFRRGKMERTRSVNLRAWRSCIIIWLVRTLTCRCAPPRALIGYNAADAASASWNRLREVNEVGIDKVSERQTHFGLSCSSRLDPRNEVDMCDSCLSHQVMLQKQRKRGTLPGRRSMCSIEKTRSSLARHFGEE